MADVRADRARARAATSAGRNASARRLVRVHAAGSSARRSRSPRPIAHVPGLGGDAVEPAADRRVAPSRTRPPRPRACTRRARCRRASSHRRRATSRSARWRSIVSSARSVGPEPRQALARTRRAARVRRSGSARRRSPARARTARRTSTAAPARASYRSAGTKRVPSRAYQRIAPDSASGRPSSSTSVGTRSAGFSPPRIPADSSGRPRRPRARSYGDAEVREERRTL